MSKQKPSIPRGTRDFGPAEMSVREFIFDTLRSVFRNHGFMPLETPAMEQLDVLTGKYGEEGDRLIFKILNSGDYLGAALKAGFDFQQAGASLKLLPMVSEKALRYDLTVPFARYVVMNQHNLTFPFKRYQIQPVWRADNPQAGRYREFYQCDVDVVGSDSLLNEFDLVQIAEAGFAGMGITGVTLRINNRKLLQGIANWFGAGDRFVEFITILDKLDKVGEEGVFQEWDEKGFSVDKDKYHKFQQLTADTDLGRIEQLRDLLNGDGQNDAAGTGLDELKTLFEWLQMAEFSAVKPVLDIFLARGLGYYTGCIFEAGVEDFRGSILGGGRYDNLTGVFGLPGLSGVGISFGADRIYDIILKRGVNTQKLQNNLRVLLVNFGGEAERISLKVMIDLRKKGIAAEIFPDSKVKAGKQFQYAEKNGFTHAIVMGDQEVASQSCNFKDLGQRKEVSLPLSGLIDHILQIKINA